MLKRLRGLLKLIFLIPLSCSHMGTVANASPEFSFNGNRFLFDRAQPKSVAFINSDKLYLVSALSFDGVAVWDDNGKITDHYVFSNPLSEATSVTVLHSDKTNNHHIALADESTNTILFLTFYLNTGKFIHNPMSIEVKHTPTHICIANDPFDNSPYLFSGGNHGILSQYRIDLQDNDNIQLKLVRDFLIGGETSSCIADNNSGLLYVVEPEVGLWHLNIDPETDLIRTLAAANQPIGQFDEPVAVSLVAHQNSHSAIIMDPETELFARISGALTESIAVALEYEDGGGEIRLLPLAGMGNLPTGRQNTDNPVKVVYASLETPPVPSTGDAADDPAIWPHPEDITKSLVLAADKKGGLMVLDLQGNQLDYIADGRLNNVDYRPGFQDHPALSHLVAATDRTHTSINLYAIDPVTLQVSRVNARKIPAEFFDPYGICMYRSMVSNNVYVIATNSSGLVHQWRLFPTAKAKVDAELVRRIELESVAEGCVADDETGDLYIGEEATAVWKFNAEPDQGSQKTAIARVEPDGELTADIEGVSIYHQADGKGYLVVSSQGSDSYAVYDREAPHLFRGMFRIRADINSGIDGVSETDGLDVISTPLPGYPEGLLVTQDGRNIEPVENQNFKFVSWTQIKAALNLPRTYQGWLFSNTV